jgi:hypothetical protein
MHNGLSTNFTHKRSLVMSEKSVGIIKSAHCTFNGYKLMCCSAQGLSKATYARTACSHRKETKICK